MSPNTNWPGLPPGSDPCLDSLYYQRNTDLQWMIQTDGAEGGKQSQTGSAHDLTVLGLDGLEYGIIGQGPNGTPYKRPPAAAGEGPGPYFGKPLPITVWKSCFVDDPPGLPPTFFCSTKQPPPGEQLYQMRTLAQVTDPGKKAAWESLYGCGVAPPVIGTFCPDDFVRRGELMVLLLKALNIPPANPTGLVFSDVPASHQFAGYIEKAKVLGITSGKSPCVKP